MAKEIRRFSQLYIERGAPLPDSQRFRNRLAGYLAGFGYETSNALSQEFVVEMGVQLRAGTRGQALLTAFFQDSEIRDVLDAASITYEYLLTHRYDKEVAEHWKLFVERALSEASLAYKVDESCVVHPLVDREFAQNIAATISGMEDARYEAARKAFVAAEEKMRQVRRDLKGAIRDTFEAAETVTKLATGSGKALTAAFIKSELEPRLQKLYGGDPAARFSGPRLAQSFADWVDAAHPYRHGHESEDPVDPPMELGILLISQGASFLRWLVDVDQQINKPTAKHAS